MQGIKEGQTHIDNPTFEEYSSWSHPIDLHYATKGLQGIRLKYIHLIKYSIKLLNRYLYKKDGQNLIFKFGIKILLEEPSFMDMGHVTYQLHQDIMN